MSHKQHNIDKAYVSPYDKFMFEFDATHEKSSSQLCEINKYKRIFKLRDTQEADPLGEIWENF